MTKYPCDGFTREIGPDDIKVGNVVRRVNLYDESAWLTIAQAPFSDHVIMAVNGHLVKLGRPMMWSNGKTHVEEYVLYDTSLINSSGFVLVLLASGKPYTMIAYEPDVEDSNNYPLKIKYKDTGETIIVQSLDDIPSDRAFLVIATNV